MQSLKHSSGTTNIHLKKWLKKTVEVLRSIEKKQKERFKIRQEIQEVNIKRKKYISEKKLDSKNNDLENALISSIKKQAMKKNFSWK